MTIEKDRAWGRTLAAGEAATAVVVSSDREARAVVEAARRTGGVVPLVALRGGDLWRTVGGPGASAAAREPMALPCDVGSILVDGRQHWFVAHLVARRSWWRGRVVAAMNAEFLGRYDVAPRGHPNDGRLDVIDVPDSLGLADRWKAWRRLPQGTHVSHPDVRPRPTPAVQFAFERPVGVWLDGVRVGEARALSIRVEPDALTVIV